MHYTGPIVRPPHEAGSLLLEVTVGCSHNSCSYCNFYEGTCFKMAPFSQIEADLKELGRTDHDAARLYALGGDPFTMSADKLIRLGRLAGRYLPEAQISMYARVDSMKNKSVEELKEIRETGINDLVIGVESGDDEILAECNKGYTVADIIEGCGKLDAAGIDYRVIYLSGLAGHGKGETNARKSAEMFNRIHPYFMYVTSVTVFPGTRMYQDIRKGKFVEAGELERIREDRVLLAGLNNKLIVSSETAGSLVSFHAEFPDEKEGLLKELDQFLAGADETKENNMKRFRNEMHAV